jgi:hypothetical protein
VSSAIEIRASLRRARPFRVATSSRCPAAAALPIRDVIDVTSAGAEPGFEARRSIL